MTGAARRVLFGGKLIGGGDVVDVELRINH
jgi:hypothetical protein